MRKILTLLCVLLALSQAITDKEIIQQGLNGVFAVNKLPAPTTIVPCIDDATAHSIVVFGGQILAKAASGSLTDLIQIVQLVKNFGDTIPQPVKDCLDGNAEVEALGLKYGIDNNTDTAALEKKIITYATLHFLEVHKESVTLNNLWLAGKYYDLGYEGGAYAHKVLGATQAKLPNLTDKEIIQQLLNGLFTQNKLPNPTTIVPCIDDETAHKIVVFGGDVLAKAAKGSIADLLSLIPLIKGFGDQIPQSVKDCLDGNAEFEALGLKYGIDNNTDTSVIEKKVITYVTLHYLQVHKWLGDLNNNWLAGKYYQVGFDGAGYGHVILGGAVKLPNLTNKQILQEGLNGLFTENKLPNSTTIVPCIDEDTAHLIVVFIGDVLAKAAKGSVTDLIALKNQIQAFGDKIPQPVKDCLDGNAELDALGAKYGLPAPDSAALEKKIIAYVTLHYLTVHKWFGDLNTEWKAGKYYQTGFDGAGYGHKVLGITIADIAKFRKPL